MLPRFPKHTLALAALLHEIHSFDPEEDLKLEEAAKGLRERLREFSTGQGDVAAPTTTCVAECKGDFFTDDFREIWMHLTRMRGGRGYEAVGTEEV